jgi:predicted protein tyrosine phosphatase
VNVLFVCSRNRLRSPTAEAVFSSFDGLLVSSAGTNPDAEIQISADLIEWADIIFAMEGGHRRRLKSQFGSFLKDKKIVVLDIPDEYQYMDPDLVRILKDRVVPFLRLNPQSQSPA